MNIFISIYNNQWETNRFKKNPKWHEFYLNLAKRTVNSENCKLEFSFLKLDDQIIASHYGFSDNDRFYYLTPTFCHFTATIGIQSKTNYSPGKILLKKLIEDCVERKIICDLMNDVYDYQLD